jgi:hypothetical protein
MRGVARLIVLSFPSLSFLLPSKALSRFGFLHSVSLPSACIRGGAADLVVTPVEIPLNMQRPYLGCNAEQIALNSKASGRCLDISVGVRFAFAGRYGRDLNQLRELIDPTEFTHALFATISTKTSSNTRSKSRTTPPKSVHYLETTNSLLQIRGVYCRTFVT